MENTGTPVRVSDRDRTEIMRQLGEGFAQGRLDQTEFEIRTDRALMAVTRADLTALIADLPADPAVTARRDLAELLLEVRWWLAGAVVTNGIWWVQHLTSDDGVRYWPGIPLAVWALILIGAVIVPRSTATPDRPQLGSPQT